jgi:hypothetical protein
VPSYQHIVVGRDRFNNEEMHQGSRSCIFFVLALAGVLAAHRGHSESWHSRASRKKDKSSQRPAEDKWEEAPPRQKPTRPVRSGLGKITATYAGAPAAGQPKSIVFEGLYPEEMKEEVAFTRIVAQASTGDVTLAGVKFTRSPRGGYSVRIEHCQGPHNDDLTRDLCVRFVGRDCDQAYVVQTDAKGSVSIFQ